MEFTKHFCRLVTKDELDDSDVILYFDIVQSYAPTKIVTAYTDDERVSIDVIAYESQDGYNIYEIILNDQINLEEGEYISDTLAEEFEFEFEFETSMEI